VPPCVIRIFLVIYEGEGGLMILDIVILIVLVIPIAIGIRRGFIYMSLQALSWVGSIIASLYLTKKVATWLQDGALGTMISDSLTDKFASSTDAAVTAANSLPRIVSGGLSLDVGSAASDAVESTSELFIQMLTGLIVSVIAFVLIALVIKLVLKVLVGPVHRRRRGVINGGDKLLGGITGLLEGVLLVSLVLAALVPIVNMGAASFGGTVSGWLDSSIFAGDLYNNNLLLLVTGGFFS
jgi:hypothetical protein